MAKQPIASDWAGEDEDDLPSQQTGALLAQPKASVPVPSVPVANEAIELPDDINKAYSLLHKYEQMPERNPSEERAKWAKVNPLKAHIGRMQQGLPIIDTHSGTHTAFVGLHNASLPQTKLAFLARTNLEVKKLLEEFEALKSENESLKKQIQASKQTKK